MEKILLLSLITFFLLAASVHAASFYPVKFDAWTGDMVLVGSSAEIPVYIQNMGLLTDSYSIKVSVPEEYSGQALIKNPSVTITGLKTNDVGSANIKLILSSDSVPVKILVASNTAPLLAYLELTAKSGTSYWTIYLAAVLLLGIILILL